MRERLVAAFVGLTVVVVALYGIPRAYFVAELVRDHEQSRVDRTADLAAWAVGERIRTGQPVNAAFLDGLTRSGEHLEVRSAEGSIIRSTDGPAPDDGDVSATRDLRSGAELTVSRGADSVQEEITKALMPLVLIGLGLVVLAGFGGYLLARRLSRPFVDLADAARGFGAGQLRPTLPTYKIPEARAIASALRTSGTNLDALLRHERELAVHASHELRTPVTALRLELEDLALWPETPASVAEALHRATGELDRLAAAIAELLAGAKKQLSATAMDLDLDALLADTVDRLGDGGLNVAHRPVGPLPTRLDPQPVIRLLAQIVSEAGARGGEVVVSARDRSTHFEVRVAADTRALTPGTEAVDLAAALGGQVATDPDGTWILRLPKTELAGPTD